jgi:tetratricopeptide (TPR) repeat protein
LPGWQNFYETERNNNFELLSVAEDTGGIKAAGPWITAGKPTYAALIDENHVVSTLYGMINVPTAVWIDEKGRLVRPPETAFIDDRFKAFTHFSSATYLSALHDWIQNSEKSQYALGEDEMRKRLTAETPEQAMSAAEFTLGEYLYKVGAASDAIRHFKEAQRLDPGNWNYKRQAWALGDSKRDYGTTLLDEMKKSSKPFYPAPDMPGVKTEEKKDNN